MFNFLCKSLVHFRYSAEISPIPISSIHLLQALKYTSGNVNPNSFTVSYLVNSCGFSSETAQSASKIVNFETPKKPELVLAFFRNHGFSGSEIQSIVQRYPHFLLSRPDKSFLPKFEFFHSKGVPINEIVKTVSLDPRILRRSLVNHIIPAYDLLKSLLKSEEKTISLIKRYSTVICDIRKLVTCYKMLLDAGVPECNICSLLHDHPRTFILGPKRLKEILEDVKKLGFIPCKSSFVEAMLAMRSMSKLTWQRKLDAYKKWGWSAEVSMAAFKRYPQCMNLSEGKINSIMKFVGEELGWESLQLAKSPVLLTLSLEKRYMPRASVLKFLNRNGLYNKGFPVKPFKLTEPVFLDKFVHPYLAETPQLLKIYEGVNE